MQPLQFCVWVMTQNASAHSHFKIFVITRLASQDIIKLWSWFCTYNYFFLDPTNQFNYFAFFSSGKHWFPDDSNHVVNGDYDYHNYDNSDNNGNYVDYNHQNNVNFMVIMITMVTTLMIMKTTMINIKMVMIIVIMMMIRNWLPLSFYISKAVRVLHWHKKCPKWPSRFSTSYQSRNTCIWKHSRPERPHITSCKETTCSWRWQKTQSCGNSFRNIFLVC